MNSFFLRLSLGEALEDLQPGRCHVTIGFWVTPFSEKSRNMCGSSERTQSSNVEPCGFYFTSAVLFAEGTLVENSLVKERIPLNVFNQ